ncbi:MAG: NAD(P)/FAD-dependent oxidoreductase [Deltaproteobacteria bacterium]|nr:FAD-dependent oxidoreductase [Deltaproteobacteria bacterium]RLB45043.1 MAG: NAD(P)/FAD-dependent oxidoreductase [Deltaproteobacteria bacterium]
MSQMKRIAVVGASLAGLRAAEFIRRAKFEGELVLIGDEVHVPYDRPPLSKEVLRGEWEPERIALRRGSYDELNLQLLLGQRAVSLDTAKREIRLEGGTVVSFDGMVIATGGQVRELPHQPHVEGIYTLRTVDDALAIRAAFASKPRVAVIGAGFIGAEVAASAQQLGLEVTMIEALETPLALSLGPRLGRVLQDAHERRGVRVLCGRRVEGFGGTDRIESVLLDDGTRVECDVVVVGIGVSPSVSWLAGSGIELDDGVRCDETLASSVPGIVAAGDVASWHNPLFEERMRVEHWTNAVEQARHAVSSLLAAPGEAKAFESVPMFWSDQFDIKIQGVGRPKPTDDLVLAGGTPESEKFIALYGRAGRLVAAVAFNQPPKLAELRMLIAKRGRVDEALKIA